MDEDNTKASLKWFDDLLANVNGTQMNLFDDYNYMTNASAATISQAASSNIWPYTITGTSGTGNYGLTSTNNNGIYITNAPNTGGTTLGYDWNISPQKQGLYVKGDAEFEGDVKVKGKSLTEMLDKIEERLAILHPNEKLEEKWLELKKLGDAYRALEKDIIEKEKIWETLKK